MEWGALIGPAVVAAGVSGIVSVVGLVASTWTARAIHMEKLASDERLAERKFESDRELAERKFTFDKELADKKFRLDAAFADRKRRQELAEEVLSSFYQVRDAVRTIRTPMRLQGEGESRPRTELEPEGVAHQRDTYYATLERLEQRRQDIGNLLAKRYRAVAWFGADADKAFEQLHKAITGIANAAELLIRWSADDTRRQDPESWRIMERAIWWTGAEPDLIANQIEAATKEMERICRAFLEAQLSQMMPSVGNEGDNLRFHCRSFLQAIFLV